MALDAGMVVPAIFGLFLLYLLCRILIRPIKWMLRLGGSCVLGGLVLFLFQRLPLGWDPSVNPLTMMMVGVLGLPGILLLRILEAFLLS